MTALRQIKSFRQANSTQDFNHMPKLSEQQLVEWGIVTNKILDNIVKCIRCELNNLMLHYNKENAKPRGLNKAKSSIHINKNKLSPNQMYNSVIMGTEELTK